MFQLYIRAKSLKSICGGFHLCKIEKKNEKKNKSCEISDQVIFLKNDFFPCTLQGLFQFLLGRHLHERFSYLFPFIL